MSIWNREEKLQTFQTPYGEFSKQTHDDTWEANVDIRNVEVGILADDANGQPDPNLLKLLPYIIENLPALEDKARQVVSRLSAQHLFDLIAQSNTDSDFRLGFSYEEEDWGESVYADFKDGEVVSWDAAD